MALAAVRSIDDAVDVTRDYLLARTVRGYLLLATVSLTLGPAGLGGPPGPVDVREETVGIDASEMPSAATLVDALGGELVLWALLSLVIALAVGYVLLGSFAEFAIYHSLITDTVAIRRPIGRYWRGALQLFAFRLVAWGLAAGASAWLAVTFFAREFGPTSSPAGLLVAAVIGLTAYLAHRLTADFVVPIMLAERCTVVAGWRDLVGHLREHPHQFGAYVPVRVVLELAGGIGLSIAVGLALLFLGLVVGVPTFALVYLLADLTVALIVAGVLLIPLGIVAVAAVILPFHVYFHSYALLLLDETVATFDLMGPWRERLAPAAAGRL
ncbi:MAG: DUF7544 domain-containing protein [Halobacteriota archaeon]